MKTILITGTTSGIGRSLSKIFARDNYHIILVSRNREKLLLQQKELQDSNNLIDIVTCDLEQQNAAQECQ